MMIYLLFELKKILAKEFLEKYLLILTRINLLNIILIINQQFLKERESPVSSLEIKYSSATDELKAKIIGGSAVSGIAGAIIGAFELYPLIPLLSSALGVTIHKDCAPCEGMVSFQIRYRDKEKNYLDKLISDKDKLKKNAFKN